MAKKSAAKAAKPTSGPASPDDSANGAAEVSRERRVGILTEALGMGRLSNPAEQRFVQGVAEGLAGE